MPGPKKFSYLLFAALVAGVALLHLGSVALAGLISYMIIDLTHRALARWMPRFLARVSSVVIFALTAVLLFWMFWTFLRLGLARTPLILASLLPRIDHLVSSYGLDLPFENLQELRAYINEALRENARGITKASGLLTKGFFQIIIGVFAAFLCFLSDHPKEYKPNLFDAVRKEFDERVAVYMIGFEKVLGAQVAISGVNTVLTGIFLFVTDIPYIHFLVLATFIFGMLPIIGNVISNTIIVATALTVSPQHAVFALGFLVLIHKGEYFLNSRIVGSSIDSPMWLTLIGILVGEVVMGVPGIILAPTMIHYVREEMLAIRAEAR